jgi:hypothetical protein
VNKNSPYYLWDPTSIGWLERCFATGSHVSKQDVKRVLDANPDLASDSSVLAWIRATRAQQPRKPAGRPKRTFHQEANLVVAGWAAQDLIAEWREQRSRGDASRFPKGRGHPSLSELAYEKMARAFRLGSGGGLANAACALKDWPYFGD